MKYSVITSASAQKDFVQNALYIVYELHNPTAADNLLTITEETVASLGTLPHRQPLVKDDYLASKGIRMIPVKRYYLFYRIDDDKKEVQIIRQLHERQNWRYILQRDVAHLAMLNEEIASYDGD
jgi:plasmid stabilization system protein ParE